MVFSSSRSASAVVSRPDGGGMCTRFPVGSTHSTFFEEIPFTQIVFWHKSIHLTLHGQESSKNGYVTDPEGSLQGE